MATFTARTAMTTITTTVTTAAAAVTAMTTATSTAKAVAAATAAAVATKRENEKGSLAAFFIALNNEVGAFLQTAARPSKVV